MSKLSELFEAVKEHNLTKTQLEAYHTELTSLYGQMRIEMADLEKAEAIFIMQIKNSETNLTDVSIKRRWNVLDKGQRLIELKNYTKGTEKILSSLKNRMYSQY